MNFTTRWRLLVITCEPPGDHIACHIALWLWHTVPFVFLTLGTTGNILSMVVLSRKKFRKISTMAYLLLLAGSDFTVLWSSLLPITLSKARGFDIRRLSIFTCRVQEWVAYSAGAFSSWLLSLLTFERVLYAKLPLVAKAKMTRRNATIISLVTLTIILLGNSYLLFSFRIVNIPTASYANNVTDITQIQKCHFESKDYEIFFNLSWTLIVYFIYNFVPMVCIVVGNGMIACALKKHRNQVQPVMNPDTLIDLRMNSITRTLFALSAFYVVTTTPFCVFTFLVNAVFRDPSPQVFAILQLCDAIVFMLLWSGFALNFLLYIASGTNFKQECAKILTNMKNSIPSMQRRTNMESSL